MERVFPTSIYNSEAIKEKICKLDFIKKMNVSAYQTLTQAESKDKLKKTFNSSNVRGKFSYYIKFFYKSVRKRPTIQ